MAAKSTVYEKVAVINWSLVNEKITYNLKTYKLFFSLPIHDNFLYYLFIQANYKNVSFTIPNAFHL
jgi:hypothetical protein